MRKVILILILIVSVCADDKIVKGCEEPHKEYIYYLNKSKTSLNSDMKERYLEISDNFHIHYKKCKINKQSGIKYQTFK